VKSLLWLLLLAVAIAAIVIVVLVWTEREAAEEQELAVLEHQLKEGHWGGPVVEGIAQNDTGLVLASAKVKVRWYSPADAVLGTNIEVRLAGLQPGETWDFEVRSVKVSFEEVSRYELEVTGIIE